LHDLKCLLFSTGAVKSQEQRDHFSDGLHAHRNAISIAVLSVIGANATPETLISGVILLTFMVGAVQLGITLFRLGDLTRRRPYDVDAVRGQQCAR
jgi:hypothetical protein